MSASNDQEKVLQTRQRDGVLYATLNRPDVGNSLSLELIAELQALWSRLEDDRTVKVWETQSGNLVRNLTGHTSGVFCVSWSPNGSWLVSCGGHDLHSAEPGDMTLRIWDLESGQPVRTLVGHQDGVYSASWSFNGRQLASAANDRKIIIWEVLTGEAKRTLTGHISRIRSVAWSPNGALIASGGADATVRVWDPSTGECLKVFHDDEHIRSITWSPDGQYLASSGRRNSLRVWEVSSGEDIVNFTDTVDGVCWSSWSPGGNMIVVASAGSLCSGGYNSVKMYGLRTDDDDSLWDSEGLPGALIILTISITGIHIIALAHMARYRRGRT